MRKSILVNFTVLALCCLATIAHAQWTPGGVLDTALDRYGNKYGLQSIAINDTFRADSSSVVLNQQLIASTGYFNVYMEPGCGMDDTSNAAHMARRVVLAKVLNDLSSLIHSPLTTTGGKVNIWLRNPSSLAGMSGDGYATSLFLLPKNTGTFNIADNMAYTTIHSGVDGYKDIYYPNAVSPCGRSFFHMFAGFNFSEFAWHTDLSTVAGSGELDLYTVILREMTHALGISSLINTNGFSVLGSNYKYYARYDKFLKTNSGTPLITQTSSSYMYGYTFNASLSASTVLSPHSGSCIADSTDCTSAIQFVGSATANLYTPNCFEAGKSLSCFEDACLSGVTNNNYYVTSNVTPTAVTKRYLQPSERLALGDIGYTVDTLYGDSATLSFIHYTGGLLQGNRVAGITDGYDVHTRYTYYSDSTSLCHINGSGLRSGIAGLLGNDLNANYVEDVKVVYSSGTLNATSASASESIYYTPSSGERDGVRIISYVPIDSTTGERGAIAYGTIYSILTDTVGCSAGGCEYLPNFGFEAGSYCGSSSSRENSSTWIPADICGWSPWTNTPDYFVNGCGVRNAYFGYSYGVPRRVSDETTLVYDRRGDSSSFIGLWGDYQGADVYGGESISTRLSTELTVGDEYTISGWAFISYNRLLSHHDVILEFHVSDIPFTRWNFWRRDSILQYPIIAATRVVDLGVGTWQRFEMRFTAPSVSGNRPKYLAIINRRDSLYGTSSLMDMVYIDDISLSSEVYATATFMNICTGGTTTLTAHSGDGGPYTWMPVTGGSSTTGATITVSPIITTSYILTSGSTASCRADTITISVVTTDTGSIYGADSLCNGSISTFAASITGGVWSSSNTSVATINPTSGYLQCISPGTTIITYSLGASSCTWIHNLTIYPQPVITGLSELCIGYSTTLTTSVTGGIWSSSNPSIATINSSTGFVNALGNGVGNIMFSTTHGCVAVFPIIIRQPTISGPSSVCQGSTINLTSLTTGVVWSSIRPATATINSAGLVTGILSDTVTIICLNPVTGCYSTRLIRVDLSPSTITGPSNVCVGQTITLSSAPSGGVWITGNSSIAVINSTTGVVTGVSNSVVTMRYRLSNGCSITRSVTVRPIPNISGLSNVCVGSTITLSSSTSGGVWTSVNSATATISSTGVILGVSADTVTIVYQNTTTGCYATRLITVHPNPTISGPTSVCQGSAISLTATPPGGTWSSLNTGVATVSSSGIVTGNSTDTVTIKYVSTAGCIAGRTITVNPSPSAITGTTSVCVGNTTSLSSASTGGTWSSLNTSVATISSTGVVTGLIADTVTIKYQNSFGCYVTALVTVNTIPASITGASAVCTGSTTTLSSATSGGTWSSLNTSIATVSASGIITGVSTTSDTTTIIYQNSTTGCYTTRLITVYPLPIISGVTSLCLGSTTTLTATPSGGTWSSIGSGVATISSSGVVTSVTTDTVTIIYESAFGCIATRLFTVHPLPSAIMGTTSICVGNTRTLSSSTTGGTWSSLNNSVATVSATGVVTGVSADTVTIKYQNSYGCYVTTLITVRPLPATITGTTYVCVGATTSLSSASSGGTWSSLNTSVATISSTGVVTGTSADTVSIKYQNAYGCYVTALVTVQAVPVISGVFDICNGSSTTLSAIPTGGTWSSLNTSVATISATGVVTGLSVDTVTIKYVNSAGCFSGVLIHVHPIPASITGATYVCIGATTNLSSTTSGGTWISLNTSVATISSSGVVTGVSADTVTIKYQTSYGCYTTALITVQPLPTISGATSVCLGASTTLTAVPAGGTWSSLNTSVATISAGGVVTGSGVDTTTIKYINTAGCYSTVLFTVHPLPASITGPTSVCLGSSITLASTTSGGTWSSMNASVATISATGVVTGLALDTVTIMYQNGFGCYVTSLITVRPLPDAITGTATVCVGQSTTLSSTTAGGTWSVVRAGVATISGAGVVTGISADTVSIKYTNTYGCFVTRLLTVNPLPTISGPTSVCEKLTITLTSTTAGVVWSSSNTAIATITSGGVLLGVAAGTVIITATNPTTGCFNTVTILVNPVPVITGVSNLCVGSTTFLVATVGGVTETTSNWVSGSTSVATVGSSTGFVRAMATGVSNITYTSAAGCIAVHPMGVAPSCICAPGRPTPVRIGTQFVSGATYTFTAAELAMLATYSAETYYITSDINCSTSVTIRNKVIAIQGGRIININSASTSSPSTLKIEGSHLFACNGMWNSIRLVTNGRAEIVDLNGIPSLIEDASNAAIKLTNSYIPTGYTPTSSSPLLLKISGAIFNRNNIGVDIANPIFSPVTSISDDQITPSLPILIKDAVFTSRNFRAYAYGTDTWPWIWPINNGSGSRDGLKDPTTTSSGLRPTDYDAPYFIDQAAGSRPAWLNPVATNAGSTVFAKTGIALNTVGTTTDSSIYTGIYVGDYSVSNYDLVLFDNLSYGIDAINSNITVRGSSFINMIWRDSTRLGAGIKSIRSASQGQFPKLHLMGVATPAFPEGNKFYNCATGVYARDLYFVKCQFAMMYGSPTAPCLHKWSTIPNEQAKFGFDIRSMRYYNIQLRDNYIYNITNAIKFNTTLGSLRLPRTGEVNISKNVIAATLSHGVSSTMEEYVLKGITVENMYSGSGTSAIGTGIHVDGNQIYKAFNGIYVQGYTDTVHKITTSANLVQLDIDYRVPTIDTFYHQYGIKHSNTFGGYIYSNSVYGSGYNTPSLFMTFYPAPNEHIIEGIVVEQATKETIDCNTSKDINTGIIFHGNCPRTQWINNYMTNNQYGYALNGDIGYQPFQVGTASPSNTMGNNWDATGGFSWGTSTPTPPYQTYVLRTSLPATNSYLSVLSSSTLQYPTSNWRDVAGAPPYIDNSSWAPGTYSIYPTQPPNLNCSDFAPTAASSSYFKTTRATARGGVYKYEQMVGGNMGYPLSPFKARKEWIARKMVYDAINIERNLLDSSTTLRQFKAMASERSRYCWLSKIQHALTSVEIDTAVALLSINKNSFVNTKVDTEYNVVMADSAEANEVVDNHLKYYTVLLHYLQDTNQVINTEDSLILRALAFKCPGVDGTVIFDARALFSQVFRTSIMFHTSECDSIARISGKDQRQIENAEQSYKLYPNPNDGHIYLQQAKNYNEPVEVEIRNIVGSLVLQKQVKFKGSLAEVYLKDTAPGVYMLRIREANGNNWNIKFIIQ